MHILIFERCSQEYLVELSLKQQQVTNPPPQMHVSSSSFIMYYLVELSLKQQQVTNYIRVLVY